MNPELQALKRIWEAQEKPHMYQQNCAHIRGHGYFKRLPKDTGMTGDQIANGLLWAMFPEGPDRKTS